MGKYHIPLLTPNSPGGLPTLSLTTDSSWLPWGSVAMPLVSPLMPVPNPYLMYPWKHMQVYCICQSNTRCDQNSSPTREIIDQLLTLAIRISMTFQDLGLIPGLTMICTYPGLLLAYSLLLTYSSRCLLWRFGVAVTRWSRSTQLLYIEPG